MRDYSSSIQRRKRGKRTEYIARLNYYDRAGKRRSVSKCAASPGDAKLELQDLITKHVHGGAELLEARGMTFAELADDCRKNRYCAAIYDKNGCKLAGVRDPRKFASIINRLVSQFGHLKLSEITVRDLQNYRTMRLKMETRRGQTTDVATVNRELSTCRAMLNDAVTNDWLLRSPFARAKRGELITVAHESKRKITASHDDEQKLLNRCNTEKRKHLKALIIAAVDTGCRQGELLRLLWNDVDFQANTLEVTSYKGKTVSKRVVPITDRLRDALLDLRTKPSSSAFRKLRSGDKPDQTLVFGIVDNIKRSFEAVRKVAGLSHIRFHDLRHTAASRLAQAGMNIALVGEILGHSDPKTTRRYINPTTSTIDIAREILNKRQLA